MSSRRWLGVCVAVTLSSGAVAACGSTNAPPSSSTTSSRPTTTRAGSAATSVGSGVATWSGSPVSATAIPLGDGKVSTTPRVGYEDSCTLSFGGGGAQSNGPWIDTTDNTWNLETKVSVQGSKTWPNASHAFTLLGTRRVLATNDLPEGATTGNFPISASDPAYQYDRNPNSIAAQSFSWTVPARPTAAAKPSCTPPGPIGVAVDGVVVFNALDALGRDAGAHEVLDSCGGHPQVERIYHYHFFSPCLKTAANSAPGSSNLVGYALDGYGIYVERDSAGNLPTDADLDACHGRTSTVMWDGKPTDMYHYDVTVEYPYLVGCFHGTPVLTGPAGG